MVTIRDMAPPLLRTIPILLGLASIGVISQMCAETAPESALAISSDFDGTSDDSPSDSPQRPHVTDATPPLAVVEPATRVEVAEDLVPLVVSVVDARGEPVSNAPVRVISRSPGPGNRAMDRKRTDESGEARFRMPAGGVTIHATPDPSRATEFGDAAAEATFELGGVAQVEIALPERDAALHVLVRDTKGRPLRSIPLQITGRELVSAMSDDSGMVKLEYRLAGTYRVGPIESQGRVAGGYRAGDPLPPITLTAGETGTVDLVLVPIERVEIQVAYDIALDEPLELEIVALPPTPPEDSQRPEIAAPPSSIGLTIPASAKVGSSISLVRHPGQGRFRTQSTKPLKHAAAIVGDGRFELRAGDEVELRLRIASGDATLRGRVVDANGFGIEGARVKLRPARDDLDSAIRVARVATSRADGTFEVPSAVEGSYDVVVEWDVRRVRGGLALGSVISRETVAVSTLRNPLEIVVGQAFDVEVILASRSIGQRPDARFEAEIEPLGGGASRRATLTEYGERGLDDDVLHARFPVTAIGTYRVRLFDSATSRVVRESTIEVSPANLDGSGRVVVVFGNDDA
jgi:hypothetical protein